MPRKRAGGAALPLNATEFGWDAARVATLEHPTLPWFRESGELRFDGESLAALSGAGTREKLSLLGQFAAHCSFLRFAGLPPSDFDAREWIVVRRRGSDSRLIRTSARPANGRADIPLVNTVEAFAASLGIDSLSVLNESWVRPEALYAEIDRKLRSDVASDLRWFRAAAGGWLLSPGEEVLRQLSHSPSVIIFRDAEVPRVLRRFAELRPEGPPVFVFGGDGTSPLQRYSAVQTLGRIESETAEAIVDRVPRAVAIVRDVESFDESSRSVVLGLMQVARNWSWALPAAASSWSHQAREEASASRPFVLSPRLAAADEVSRELNDAPDRRERLDSFVSSPQFSAFLEKGSLPASWVDLTSLPEPRRSYLAALAILGSKTELSLCRELLAAIGCCLDVSAVALEPIASLSRDGLSFASEQVRRRLIESIPPESRHGLAAFAAALLERRGDLFGAAMHYHQSGEDQRALELLEAASSTEESALLMVEEFGSALLHRSAALSAECARALIAVGRYQDARAFAEKAHPEARALLLARIDRRAGDFSAALQSLAGVAGSGAAIARAELYRLQARYDEAAEELERAAHDAGVEHSILEYESAILALDRGTEPPQPRAMPSNPYLYARWRGYHAMTRHDYEEAAELALDAVSLAGDIAEAIDASMDVLYARFLAGDWEGARHESRRALSLVEQTQGDRAAGGILYTLAYLCADSGRWSEAEYAIARQEAFYRSVADERRIDELRMLRAHLAFCRGRFLEARQHLAAGADSRWSRDIREAAFLILDEIDWVEGHLAVVRTAAASDCLELNRRHELNASRAAGRMVGDGLDAFSIALAQFELGITGPPAPPNRSAGLRLFRSIVAVYRRRPSDELKALATSLGKEFQIDDAGLESSSGALSSELAILQQLSAARFPLQPSDLGDRRWRFVSRNRLDQWTQQGSLSPLPEHELIRLDQSLPSDWIACGEASFVFLEGLDRFSPQSRDAVRSLFILQADLFRLRRVAEQEQTTIADRPGSVDGILGDSPAIREALSILERVGRRDVPVCILGESGTGKELFARAIHRKSPRRNRTFTAINCAALPENLVESELFGHARGAFTGADRDRAGLLEVSDGGTLFLDEIGELPSGAQAKLLRFLQEGEFRRVGETPVRCADVRVIAATNRKLEDAVDAGTFREDLYYRVRGIEMVIPPLRQRGSDVLLLARHFLALERDKHRGGPSRMSDEVEAILVSNSWPGNVRELQNTIRSAHALAGDASVIETEHLPGRLKSVLVIRSPRGNFQDELQRFRRGLIEKSLLESRGNQNRAAKSLGMTRQALAYQIRELGILIQDFTRQR